MALYKYVYYYYYYKLQTNITGGYRSRSSEKRKESVIRAELKRCISIERRWNRNEVWRYYCYCSDAEQLESKIKLGMAHPICGLAI